MKILFHHRIRSKDGQFVHLEELTQALAEAGHEVVIVGPRHLAQANFGADAGFVDRLKRGLPRWLYETLEFLYSFAALARILRAIRRERPDVVYERYNLFFPAGVWASRLCGLPLLLEVNAPLFDERSRFDGVSLHRLARWSESHAWRRADHVLPVTAVLARRVMEAGVPPERITVVHNGVDERRFVDHEDSWQLRSRHGVGDRCLLGFVGFARPWHGLDAVVRYLAAHPERNGHLLLVGDGQVCADLERLAGELGIGDRLTVTGVVQRDAVAQHVRAFDIALQPAVVEYASPLKLFEYMVCGKAIIAPASDNIREILTDNVHGLLFEPGDQATFTRALDRLCREPALRERLGRAAQALIVERGLTWRANAERVVAIAMREVEKRNRVVSG